MGCGQQQRPVEYPMNEHKNKDSKQISQLETTSPIVQYLFQTQREVQKSQYTHPQDNSIDEGDFSLEKYSS